MYLVVLLLSAAAAEDVSRSADLLLRDVKAYLKAMDLGYVVLGAFEAKGMSCTAGKLGDISGIYRKGQVELTNSEDRAELKVNFSFDSLDVSYPHCKFLLFKQDLRIQLPQPEFHARFVLERKGTQCVGRLEDLTLNLKRIRFLTTLRVFGIIENIVINAYLHLKKSRIVHHLEQEIIDYTKKFKSFKCSDDFNHDYL
ncbi:uncharacterized protein LOC106663009 [Cimex lectularius]|uniref:Uncharacterized protein n=1 Tax=Cimex lectularius TaxID=79782 RepID=A0A8I6RBM4_CIMLE|nr:uncharacterized protein LOC106663009 [Cimex lectularius]